MYTAPLPARPPLHKARRIQMGIYTSGFKRSCAMGGPARGAGVPGCAPDGVLIAHVHGTHVLCDCWMPSYPADSGRIATSTAAHCTGPRQTLPRAEFEPSLPRSSGLCIVGGLHRRPTRPAPASTSVTRDLLHPRSSSALSDRDHTRARAPRLLCSLVLHLSPSARSACASAWPHPGRGRGPLRWAGVALSVSSCLPPGRLASCLSVLVRGWGGRGGKKNSARGADAGRHRRASDGHPPRCVA